MISSRSPVRLLVAGVLSALPAVLCSDAIAKPPSPPSQRAAAQTVSTSHVIYKNKRYRFRVTLPASWKGFSISISEWTGSVMNDEWQMIREERGPAIWIRHPLWTEENPRQDIPIMIFTKAQWSIVEKDRMILSAAPIGPGEIGRNKKYVFALPARYNYAFPVGWEEVEKIIVENSLQPY